MGHIDRKKHDADVMERVLGVDNDEAPQSQVINLDVRPWMAGTVASAVQFTIGDYRRERMRGRADDDGSA